jgi:hypothetical protein
MLAGFPAAILRIWRAESADRANELELARPILGGKPCGALAAVRSIVPPSSRSAVSARRPQLAQAGPARQTVGADVLTEVGELLPGGTIRRARRGGGGQRRCRRGPGAQRRAGAGSGRARSGGPGRGRAGSGAAGSAAGRRSLDSAPVRVSPGGRPPVQVVWRLPYETATKSAFPLAFAALRAAIACERALRHPVEARRAGASAEATPYRDAPQFCGRIKGNDKAPAPAPARKIPRPTAERRRGPPTIAPDARRPPLVMSPAPAVAVNTGRPPRQRRARPN